MPREKRRLLSLVVPAVLCGCDAGFSAEVEPAGDGPGGGVTGPEACRAYVNALADKAVECASRLGMSAPSREVLRSQFESAFPGGCAAVTGVRDPGSFQSTCLPAIRNIDCAQSQSGVNPAAIPAACANQFVFRGEEPQPLPDAGPSPGCTQETDAAFCARLGKTCGRVMGTDNCGAARLVASCGTCASPATCGGGSTANVCGTGSCTPKTCTSLGKNCGSISDGCSAVLNCGGCAIPQTCGGAGVPNVCL